jgi:hypothetical protein
LSSVISTGQPGEICMLDGLGQAVVLRKKCNFPGERADLAR